MRLIPSTLGCAVIAFLFCSTVQGAFEPPFAAKATKPATDKKEQATPYLDTENSTFVFGNKQVIFSGAGNFTILEAERKIADFYMTFSSAYGNWLATNCSKCTVTKTYDGSPLCITERTLDKETSTLVVKGLAAYHEKSAAPEDYKPVAWEQISTLLPDGRLEVIFRNAASDKLMNSRPNQNLNGYFFNLGQGISYSSVKHRLHEKGLAMNWRYYRITLNNGTADSCMITVDRPSILNENPKRESFYMTLPNGKEQRYVIDMLNFGAKAKKVPGGIDFQCADQLTLPASPCRNLLPNPYFASGKQFVNLGGYHAFPGQELDLPLATLPVLFGKYSLPAGEYQFASVPADPGTYTFSFYLNGKGTYTAAVGNHEPYKKLGRSSGMYDTKGEWQRFEFSLTSATPGILAPAITFSSGVLDGMQLEAGDKATEFDASALAGKLVADTENGVGFFESGKPQNIALELSTLKTEFKGKVTVTVKNFYRETVLSFEKDLAFRKGHYPLLTIPAPEKGFADGVYTIELKSGAEVSHFRFSVMPFLKNQHATAKIFSPSYGAFWGYVDECSETYLKRLRQIGYGCQGHTPSIGPKVMALYQKYGIIPFDASAAARAPIVRYQKIFPELADKLVTGHVYFGVMDNWYPIWEMVKEKGLLADYRLLGGWNEQYKAKFQEAVKTVLKKNPGRFAYGIGGEWPEEIKGDPHYPDLVLAYFEAVKSVYPDAYPYEQGAANLQIRDGVAEYDRFLGQIKERWPIKLVSGHPYNGDPTEFYDQFMAYLDVLEKHDLKDAIIAFPEFMHFYPYGAPLWDCNPISAEKNSIKSPLSYDLGWTEQMSAAYYARCYLICMIKFKQMICVTSAVTSTANLRLDIDMTPRVSQKVINTLGTLLGNPKKFLDDCSFGTKVRCFVWESEDSTPLAAVWSEDKQLSSGFVPFPKVTFNYSEAQFIDLMGVVRTPEVKGQFQLTPFPYFIRGKKGDNARFLAALKDAEIEGAVRMPCTVSGKVADATAVEYTLTNGRAKEVVGKFTVEGQSFQLLVPAHGSQKITVKVPEVFSPGQVHKLDQQWTLEANGASFNGTFKETVVAIPKFTGDWTKVPAMAFPCYSKTKLDEDRGYPGDFDATFQAAWTPEQLYIRVAVIDDCLTAGDGPGCRWNYDVCQIFMDTRCSARTNGKNVFDDDDYDYALMPTVDGKACQVWRALSPFVQFTLGTAAPKDKQLAPEIPARFTKTENGYVYEAEFPAAYVLPIKLTEGWNFALGVYVADRDKGDGVKQAKSLAIDPKGGCWNKPLNWPIAVLVE